MIKFLTLMMKVKKNTFYKSETVNALEMPDNDKISCTFMHHILEWWPFYKKDNVERAEDKCMAPALRPWYIIVLSSGPIYIKRSSPMRGVRCDACTP